MTPLGGLRITRPFVPFTDARIAFGGGASPDARDVDILLVNGRQISWLGEATGGAGEPARED